MVRKLAYSRAAMLRRIAMANDASLFVFVEGKHSDAVLVDALCEAEPAIADAGYEVRVINQVQSATGNYAGGKSALIDFYEYCKAAGKLTQFNKAGKRVIAILVDRDSQHITGGRKRSPHVVYTRLADAEAHFFADSDELRALATAASLDVATTAQLLGSLGDWRAQLADAWRSWIELCYVAEATNASCWVGLGHDKSLIHKSTVGAALDATKYAKAQAAVASSTPLTAADYAAREKLVLRRIDLVYQRGEQATLLKGKWLPARLTELISVFFGGVKWSPTGWHEDGFKASVTRCYASRLDPDAPRVVEMRVQLASLL